MRFHLLSVAAVAVALAGLASFAAEREPSSKNELFVRPGASGCVVQALDSAEVDEVRGLLARLDEEQSTSTVRDALLGRYGARVSEAAVAMHYLWVLIEGRWVLVCTSSSAFTVDFGDRGSVVVESRASELPPPQAH